MASNQEEWREAQEAEAEKGGWKPLDEWDGEPKDWADAPEFNVRGQLMKRIQRQSRELQDLKTDAGDKQAAIKALGEQNRKLAEREFAKAKGDLLEQKKRAYEEGNVDALVDLDERILDMNKVQQNEAPVQTAETGASNSYRNDEIVAKFQNWMQDEDNTWFRDNIAMRNTAMQLGDEYLNEDPDIAMDTLFDKISTRTKEMFKPADAEKAPKRKASQVDDTEPGSSYTRGASTRGSKNNYVVQLNEEQRRVALTLAKADTFQNDEGTLSEKDQIAVYAKQLHETGALDE